MTNPFQNVLERNRPYETGVRVVFGKRVPIYYNPAVPNGEDCHYDDVTGNLYSRGAYERTARKRIERAAPDLLAALRGVTESVVIMMGTMPQNPEWDAALEAISKAEGR